MTTRICKDTTSDLSLGGLWTRVVSTGVGGAGSRTASPGQGATVYCYWVTPLNDPNNADWGTPGAITVELDITTADMNVDCRVLFRRVESDGTGTGDQTTYTSWTTLGSVQVYDFSTGGAKTWSAGAAGDRLVVQMAFTSAAHSGGSVTFDLGTADSEEVDAIPVGGAGQERTVVAGSASADAPTVTRLPGNATRSVTEGSASGDAPAAGRVPGEAGRTVVEGSASADAPAAAPLLGPVARDWTVNVTSVISTTIIGTVPAGTEVGDLLVAFWTRDDDNDVPTPPAGWALIETEVNYVEISTHAFARIATAVDVPGVKTYTWTNSDAEHQAISIVRVTNHGQSLGDEYNVAGNTSGTSISADSPSIVTTVDNELVFVFFGRNNGLNGSEDTGYPSGTTGLHVRETTGGSGNIAQGIAHFDQASAGATGIKTWDEPETSDVWTGWSISIKPPGVEGQTAIVTEGTADGDAPAVTRLPGLAPRSVVAGDAAGDAPAVTWSSSATRVVAAADAGADAPAVVATSAQTAAVAAAAADGDAPAASREPGIAARTVVEGSADSDAPVLDALPGEASRSVDAGSADGDAPAVAVSSALTANVSAATSDGDAPAVTRAPGIATRAVVEVAASGDAPVVSPEPGAVVRAVVAGDATSDAPEATAATGAEPQQRAVVAAAAASDAPAASRQPGGVERSVTAADAVGNSPLATASPGVVSRAVAAASAEGGSPAVTVLPGGVARTVLEGSADADAPATMVFAGLVVRVVTAADALANAPAVEASTTGQVIEVAAATAEADAVVSRIADLTYVHFNVRGQKRGYDVLPKSTDLYPPGEFMEEEPPDPPLDPTTGRGRPGRRRR